MKKLYIVFLLAILTLTGCWNNQSKYDNSIVSDVNVDATWIPSLPENIEYPSFKDVLKDIPWSYTNDNEVNRCVVESVDSCMSSLISTKNSLDICNDYILDSNKTSCKNEYYISQAKALWDSSVCEKIIWDQQACINEVNYAIAIKESNLWICDVYENEEQRIECRDIVAFMLAESKQDKSWCVERYIKSIKMKKILNKKIVSLFLGILLVVTTSIWVVYALNTWDTGYRINNGTTLTNIRIASTQQVCRVTNNHGSALFIPTKTTSEYNSFKSNKPSWVTIGRCCNTPALQQSRRCSGNTQVQWTNWWSNTGSAADRVSCSSKCSEYASQQGYSGSYCCQIYEDSWSSTNWVCRVYLASGHYASNSNNNTRWWTNGSCN